ETDLAALDEDVLEPCPERRLDGPLEAGGGAQHVGDQAEDALGARLAAGAQHHRPDPAIEALVVALDLLQGVEAAAPVGQLLAEVHDLPLALGEGGAVRGERVLLGTPTLGELEREQAALLDPA